MDEWTLVWFHIAVAYGFYNNITVCLM